MNGVKYLTVNRTKRRYDNKTPEACKYFAYPFIGEFGIMDDFDKAPQWERNIYSPQRERLLEIR